MTAEILPLAESHFDGLRAALDVVAREKRYLALTRAPSLQDAHAFYGNVLAKGLCLYVALLDGTVVGWCDILPAFGESRAHVGILGMGVVPLARGRGIGRALIEAAIGRAWEQGFSRIELAVRTDNPNAKALYDRMGFEVEGLNRSAFRIDGQHYDAHAMALLRPEESGPAGVRRTGAGR